jgi:peptide/nickel transport system permease protein
MEELTWTGALAPLNLALAIAVAVLILGITVQILISLVPLSGTRAVFADGTMASNQGVSGLIGKVVFYALLATIAIVLLYIVGGVAIGTGGGIIGGMAKQLLPVWIALVATFALSITFKRKLGLYGKLFDSTVGMIGFGLVMFWVFAAFFGGALNMIVTHDTLSQFSGMKNKLPGTPLSGAGDSDF